MAKITNSPLQTLQLELERRKSFALQVNVLYSNGTPVSLLGARMRFVLKTTEFDDDHYDVTNLMINNLAYIPAGEEGKGYGVFSFQAAELDMEPGEYYGAIVLTTGDNYSLTLMKVVLTLQPNTESDSMHLQFSTSAPPTEVEVMLRGNQVVNVTTGNMAPAYVHRGPTVRTTAQPIGQDLEDFTTLLIADLQQLAYPTGGLVEVRPGDLVVQTGIDGQLVMARVVSVDNDSMLLVTVVSTEDGEVITGNDGREVILAVNGGFIQWQYTGDPGWTNLISLAALTGPAGADGDPGADGSDGIDGTNGTNGADGDPGAPGPASSLRVSGGFIQWQNVGDVAWNNLISLAAITGPAGTDGTDGTDGTNGSPGAAVSLRVSGGFIQWQRVGDAGWTNLISTASLVGPTGPAGLIFEVDPVSTVGFAEDTLIAYTAV